MSTVAALRTNPRPAEWDQLPGTLPEALLAADPDTPLIFADHQGRERASCYGELVAQARRTASGWRAQGVAPGTKVLLQLSHNEQILPAFWGCLFAGLEPVIVPVPVAYDLPGRQVEQLQHLYDLLECPLILTNEEHAAAVRRSPGLTLLHDAGFFDLDELGRSADDGVTHRASPEDVAFYTLSSGSTGLPKAVTLTHRNMISRGRGANQLCGNRREDVILSWLPFDHIGNISAYHVSPILTGSKLVYLPKEFVLAKPLRWLDWIDRHRVTHTWAPNFAFGLVSKALKGASGAWDLSCLRGLLSAGELIAHTTATEFLAATAPYGLRPEALISAFGMAEVCSGVNYHLPAAGDGLRFAHLDRRHLDGTIRRTAADDPYGISFASLGPIAPGMAMRIVGEEERICDEGEIGRFQLKGDALMKGYYRNPEANRAFTAEGWFDTGDAAFIVDGELYLVGRAGLGIIVNGANLSNAEVESAVEEVAGVEPSYTAACTVFPPGSEELKLAVFYHPADGLSADDAATLPRRIQARMSKHLGVRADFLIALDKEQVPKTEIGKIQHKRLIQRFQAGEFADAVALQSLTSAEEHAANSGGGLEGEITRIWYDLLPATRITPEDNFFELGGDSLALMQALDRINEAAGASLALVDLFKYTTIAALVAAIEGSGEAPATERAQRRAGIRRRLSSAAASRDIAVIGMAGRFPGADNLEEFWNNLVAGVESITRFDDRALERSGFSRGVYDRPEYVKASPMLKDARRFDAEFFGYSRHDAELMDPQQRQFLECAWEAFEDAGYDPTTYPGTVGVYAGAAMNTYLFNNVLPNRHTLDPNDDLAIATLDSMGGFMAMVGNDKDYLTTRVSYKLNLGGPSVNVQTACSTGLVCIHMACQALLAGEADLFLAGSSSIQSPEQAGHLYQTGMIVSPDGHVRSFDAKAGGTIFGSGVGAVLLKRLDDAIADGDHIHAVVKGTAINNDAGAKVGYMAPSSEGQAIAVGEALAIAEVPAETIGLVEAHGTGTVVGDPIEFDGLRQVFRSGTDKSGFCALGSVKANVGHLQITSGAAGFIKTALAVEHGRIPPLVHFESPNPALAIEDSPFFINTETIDWPLAGPRRASVNSLGIGGTNAHVVLEQAPALAARDLTGDRPAHLLLLSARTPEALRTLATRYRDHLAAHPEQPLGDVCFTANLGRKRFAHRLAVHGGSHAALVTQLERWLAAPDAANASAGEAEAGVAFLFTGQGSQYVGMAGELYATQAEFRRELDRCAELFAAAMGIDLIELVTSPEVDESRLTLTRHAQPAIFSVDYALARLWQSWGVEPDYLLGHSLGEYVAACIAGVFSLEDAVKLVSTRAELMQAEPAGGEMWALTCDAKTARSLIGGRGQDLALAADNAPQSVVIAGAATALNELAAELERRDIQYQKLPTSHAFHSPLMRAAAERFEQAAAEVRFHPPQIPLIANLTGSVASEEITSADYWAQHMLRTVQFRQSMTTLESAGVAVMLEVGPKPILRGLGAQCLPEAEGWLHSLHPRQPAWDALLGAAAELARRGRLDPARFDAGYPRRRVPLPTYPFAATRYWLEPPETAARHPGGESSRNLLGERLPLPGLAAVVFENRFDPLRLPVLRDHLVHDVVVVSAACLVNMMLEASQTRHPHSNAFELHDVMFERPLIVQEEEERDVQTVIAEDGEAVEIQSLVERRGDTALRHVSGRIRAAQPQHARRDPAELLRSCPETRLPTTVMAQLKERNFTLGPSYRWMSALHLGGDQAVAELKLPGRLGGLAADTVPHPGLLDTCFGLLLATARIPQGSTWLPFGINRLHWTGASPAAARYATITVRPESNDELVVCDGWILDGEGRVLVAIDGLQGRPMQPLATLPQAPVKSTTRYASHWQALPAANGAQSPARWLILGNVPLAQELGAELTAAGHTVSLADDPATHTDEVDGVISLQALAHASHQLPTADADPPAVTGRAPSGLLNIGAAMPSSPSSPRAPSQRGLGALATEAGEKRGLEPADEEFSALYRNLASLQFFAARGNTLPRGFWLVSFQGAALSPEEVPDPAQASLHGLCLSARHEHPELNLRRVDVAAGVSAADLARLVGAAPAAAAESPILALRGERQWQQKLTPATLTDGAPDPLLRPDRSYLITGAHGALGQIVGDWLLRCGARHLVLLARSQPPAERREALDKLAAGGITVTYAECDLADPAQVEAIMRRPELEAFPPAGVFHCAGVLYDRPLTESTAEDVHRVLAGKALGAKHLDAAIPAEHPLDYFVLFSSAASVLGNGGQIAYAAANAYLDGLAHRRKAQGLAASAINWGPWAGDGMASHTVAARQLAAQGIAPIAAASALRGLADVLAGGEAQAALLECDWAVYADAVPANVGVLDPRMVGEARPKPAKHSAIVVPAMDFSALARGDQRDALQRLVTESLADTLAIGDPGSIPTGQPMTELGLDSLLLVQLRNKISRALGASLPIGMMFSYPTVEALVAFLETQVATTEAPATAGDAQAQEEVEALPRVEEQAESLLSELDQLLNG
ncbi:SDR family NAD(P)-dependent oxidoreductase [Endothiovibrio diazotrophicus]